MPEYQLICVIVPRGEADAVVDAAKAAGAEGATIMYARGTGIHEARTFFGLHLSSEREVALILIERSHCQEVLRAAVAAGHLEQPGRGIAFVLNVPQVVGIIHRGQVLATPPSEETTQ
jgi:nitrogen regulatory protein P-II 1